MSFRRQSVHNFSPYQGATTPLHNPIKTDLSGIPNLERKGSLVKPTWQNVSPGQVSTKMLDKVNGIETDFTTTTTSNGSIKTLNNNNNICAIAPKEQEIFDIFGKVMLLGDSGVGKTCLLVRFRDGTFLGGNFISTVGIDFRNKVVTVDHTKVKLQIWDTAGQERFRSVTHAYYRDAHALLLLYDVTNKISFDNIRAWLVEIREYAQEDVVIMLLGNKADAVAHDRQVKKEDGERLAKEYNVAFMETSAKTGLNVELAFVAIARQLKSRRSDSIDESKFNVVDFVNEKANQEKQTCPPCNM
ncbi:ras-related protein Rab-37 isoform X1 [Condylostylus longicornis]|uniref:ras-related protein Rab-37 isoform X1 n=1 Tax=Condylostylus longicornis TaxID=2530218 RepID=UPI00244E4F98|nr:ras-related protein Rab-37 isoform X1 [Condylostylus longicornis]